MAGHLKNDPERLGLLSVPEVISDKNVYLFFVLFFSTWESFSPKELGCFLLFFFFK